YLKAGADNILSGAFAPRTPREVFNRTVIPVKDASGAEDFRGRLVVPDCSGELWLDIYRKREWSEDWENIISDLCGCLLFVRIDSDETVNPLDWVSCEKLLCSPANFPDLLGNEEMETITPTQVVLVDWLQFLRRAFTDRVGGSFRPRIGIVITAWDFVPKEQEYSDPGNYLKSNFPLLWQFMLTNTDRFDFATFGLSITGGNLNDATGFRKDYLNSDPHKAGYVVHSEKGVVHKSGDLTLPVAWAMGLEVETDRQRSTNP
ncbi:MAG: hypothetical protein KAV87_62545, partial [Desulfobacteraceae bacterium]|nr:hypothetical protein [Desulfobacteraceae bacterium]